MSNEVLLALNSLNDAERADIAFYTRTIRGIASDEKDEPGRIPGAIHTIDTQARFVKLFVGGQPVAFPGIHGRFIFIPFDEIVGFDVKKL